MTRNHTESLFVLRYALPLCHSDSGLPSGGSATTAPVAAGSNGAGGANGATTNGAVTNTGTTSNGTDWSAFAAGLDRLGDNLAQKLDGLRADVGQLPDHLRPPAVEPPPPDFDSMTQGELAAHITGSVMKAFEAKINDILAPITAQINDVRQSAATRDVTQEVAALRESNKDFNDWKDEMVSLAKQHPTLGIKQLYNLVRADNPAKAGELDRRYNPPPPPAPKWGGLTPSALHANGGQPPLTREQASADAYREVAARHPGVLAALESM